MNWLSIAAVSLTTLSLTGCLVILVIILLYNEDHNG